MALKEWIDRKGQNAKANHEIKDWQLVRVKHYGNRAAATDGDGFEHDVDNEATFLGELEIRLDKWRGQTKPKLDLVGKTDVLDIRKGDHLKFSTENGEYDTVVNTVEIFADTMELGIKYA